MSDQWKPKVGDWMISLASYCHGNPECSEQEPCEECLEMCNRYVISGEHYGRLFFYGGQLCNRDGGTRLNQTCCYIMSPFREEVTTGDRNSEPVAHISKFRHIKPA